MSRVRRSRLYLNAKHRAGEGKTAHVIWQKRMNLSGTACSKVRPEKAGTTEDRYPPAKRRKARQKVTGLGISGLSKRDADGGDGVLAVPSRSR